MNKRKRPIKRLRLTLLFSAIVFLILLITMCVMVLGLFMLTKLNLISLERTEKIPFILIFSLVSIILGTVLAAIVSEKTMKPLREIMEATDQVAAGDYSVRIHPSGPEEIRMLGDKFNHMAEELNSVEMLGHDFINNFSHELKTPIVSIRGFAKALKRKDLTEDEQRDYLDTIIFESGRLSNLAANILLLTKLEKQENLTNTQQFNLTEQIRRAVILLANRCDAKNVDIVFTADEYEIVGNQEMLDQIWINLLDNAIKFSPENGVIRIRMTRSNHELLVEFADEGPGIPADIQSRIFERFYQGDTAHSTAGNGLGLTIACRCARLHGGSIEISSLPDHGATFIVHLPTER